MLKQWQCPFPIWMGRVQGSSTVQPESAANRAVRCLPFTSKTLLLTCCSMTPLGNTHWHGWPWVEKLCTNSIPRWLASFLTRYTRCQSFWTRVQNCSTCFRKQCLSSDSSVGLGREQVRHGGRTSEPAEAPACSLPPPGGRTQSTATS